jgi:hypothetical protein
MRGNLLVLVFRVGALAGLHRVIDKYQDFGAAVLGTGFDLCQAHDFNSSLKSSVH